MKCKVIAALAIAFTASGALAQSPQDITNQRLIDYGLLPEPINPSMLVVREIIEPDNPAQQRAIEWGLLQPETREVGRHAFARREPGRPLSENEQRLQELGFLPHPLTIRFERVVHAQEGLTGEAESRDAR